MPLLSAVAVALCVAMVLVVWSVMGGFLNMLLAQGRGMIGDVAITVPYGLGGVPHYEELIGALEAEPVVAAATPTIEALALLALPSGDTKPVQVVAVEPEGYDRVTGFFDRLYWRPLDHPLPKDTERRDLRARGENLDAMGAWLEDGRLLAEPDAATGEIRPAVVLGTMVAGVNERTRAGYLQPYGYLMPREEVSLSVLPVTRRGGAPIKVEARRFPVANEFSSGLYEADANWVIAPLGVMQRMLLLDAAERITPDYQAGRFEVNEAGEEVFVAPEVRAPEPARVTNILLRAAEGVTPEALEARVEVVYRAFAKKHPVDVYLPTSDETADLRFIYTWDKKPGLAMFIAAVRKETALVLVLFSFISLTAVFLIFSIFWSMVSEKTKDIGTLRAIGASRAGVAWLYLRYGLAIGVCGSAVGGTLAFLIVRNINPIHDWMGRALGLEIWNPETYYFTTIPNRVDPLSAAIVLAGGVLFSVMGALLPALRAARMDPVRALRFE